MEQKEPIIDKVEHYGWSFDYMPIKFIYDIDENIADTTWFQRTTDVKPDPNLEIASMLDAMRIAGTVHRLARKKVRSIINHGTSYTDIASTAENEILRYLHLDPVTYYNSDALADSGIAFPIGISANEIAAHDTAMIDDTRSLENGDVVKIDIGVMKDGYIVDSAFTCIVGDDGSSCYNPLLNASADAVYTGIAVSGPDARLYEISEMIAEVISSYQVEEDGKTLDVVPVYGLGGHSIERHNLHSGKLILSKPHKIQENWKMEEGEVYAIETYASTGYGTLRQCPNINHYALNKDIVDKRVFTRALKNSKTGFERWLMKRGSLPFSPKWFDPYVRRGENALVDGLYKKFITGYPSLTDEKNSRIAQFEHTIYIRNSGVEILSLGDDY